MSIPPTARGVAWAPWLCLAAVPATVAVILTTAYNPRQAEATAPLRDRSRDYTGASACRSCHPDRFESWQRTYHRTMTQLPTRGTVLGRFDGKAVAAFGASAIPFEREGRFFFRLPPVEGEPARETEVALTVGSRRYQQYFERMEDRDHITYRRLPLLWHVEEERWLHLNGVFLEKDRDDWRAHRAIWNLNCIFCHNTGIAPGVVTAQNGRGWRIEHADSHVSDLGISCEACHGPGRTHGERNRSPTTRYLAGWNPTATRDIVDPMRLAQSESIAVCGQCHSQRLPDPRDRLPTFLATGPTFRPGDVLQGHVAPLTRDTPVPDDDQPDAYRDRFWSDGTARLSSYEYLGVTQSPCFKDRQFTCERCHTMHGGDIRGQISPGMRGDQACTQCHRNIAEDIQAHTHHLPSSTGSRCLDCHMPRMVYGILEVHRSHRVESPDVKRDVESGRPNACTACHLDRSALWAAERMRDFWGSKYEPPDSRKDGAPLGLSDALASLHAGDPVQRVVYAWQFGRADAALSKETRTALLGNLLVGFVDPYGAVRLTARRSALRLDQMLNLGLSDVFLSFDVQAEPARRNRDLLTILRQFETAARERARPPPAGLLVTNEFHLEIGRVRSLLDHQAERAIETGE
ncbi:MAG TPA: cytochrome c3 family protein [Polyangiaceae bacterium]|nr:cytochrome c3 family protein [Polyangiaceae bacterium]